MAHQNYFKSVGEIGSTPDNLQAGFGLWYMRLMEAKKTFLGPHGLSQPSNKTIWDTESVRQYMYLNSNFWNISFSLYDWKY